VLRLGHHGSSTSTTPDFLAAVSPSVAIFSAGVGNRYGHPHEEVVARVTGRGIALYGTATHGTVTVVTDGVTFDVRTRR
jgi:competence protein ComEC